MKSILSLLVMFILITLSSCTKEYTCECVVAIGGITTQSEIEARTKTKAKSLCDENDTELLGVVVAECEII